MCRNNKMSQRSLGEELGSLENSDLGRILSLNCNREMLHLFLTFSSLEENRKQFSLRSYLVINQCGDILSLRTTTTTTRKQ